ncbi:unnamed protein product [Thlaspi arvense]|uniref:Uncharacterized protein n=1 Tax=Thlaspi arvense TaxID=13288 RepID=A0AAU9S2D6_THLAR|nr:unnamed protein product [Thlaspi arvense]
MLDLFMGMAFSALPLTLYIPPVRSLTLFTATMEKMLRDHGGFYSGQFYPRLRFACSRLLNCILCNSR